jgi:glycine/D-amino acid oxidase-like deaminating enzyme/nitrite reductase/ring-hydroxylating ferredoxin subunit
MGDFMNSYWKEYSNKKNYSSLKEDIYSDVCIIGAGITGCTLAYLLNKKGKHVTLLEKDDVVSGVTANTTGKITSQHGLFYDYLVNSFGIDFAKKYLMSNQKAITSMKDIIDEEHIECDFEFQNAYVYTKLKQNIEKIQKEVGIVNTLGLDAKFVDKTNLPFDVLGAIEFPDQAQFHVRKYTLGLLDTIPDSSIYTDSKVLDVKPARDGYIVSTASGTVTAKYVAITSHYPIINFPGLYFLKLYQDKSYIIGVDTKEELFPGMYISEEEPTISLRTAIYKDKRLLLVGGSDHKTGDTDVYIENSYYNLEKFIKTIYPKAEVLYKWSTEDCVSLDKIPYIGEYSNIMPNVFVATGYKKWGMTSSYVAAKIIFDKIIGIDNEYESIYSSTRLQPIKNSKEFGNMLKQTTSSLILDRIIPSEKNLSDLEIGSGGLIEYHGKKLGVYKKSESEIYAVEPYCAHLGCQLSWNNLEKTWDCPCHGSRYHYDGKLITEPSKKDLKTFDIDKL